MHTKMVITQEELKRLLDYNPNTGIFTWKNSSRGRSKGKVAGHLAKIGYITIRINFKLYMAHRLAFLFMFGYLPEYSIDHINRIRNDNRISNLREASQQCQMRNSSMLKNNNTGIKGVSWADCEKKWIADVKVNGKLKRLGRFNNFEDAVYTRFAAEQCLGFQECDINTSAKRFINKDMLESSLNLNLWCAV